MIYPKNFENKIGFDVVRHEIERRCTSTMGVACCQAMHFSAKPAEVQLWLRQTNEFLAIVQAGRDFPVSYYFDLRSVLHTISAPGTFVTVDQLYDLQRSLGTVSEIISFFNRGGGEDGASPYPCLKQLTQDMQAFPELVSEINRIIDKFGNVKDSASPELSQLRSIMSRTQASINGIMRRIISQGRQGGYLESDTAPSVRDGRLVLPVSPANKRKVRGIVHDESASGKTIFIEPEEIVEANNRIRETEGEIRREIMRILVEVTDKIRPHISELEGTYEVLGQLDFIRAKAEFARDVDAQMPHLHGKVGIEWYGAKHPALLLSLARQGKQVVPLNIELNAKNRIVIISGPNAGGKSVCLKTVGIIQYMMQCGVLPTLYSNSHMGIYKSIFIDIGDQQSIEDDLSTYSSHLQDMKHFMSHGDRDTLILIDEFGSGTEPQIGAAIAQAILEQLNLKLMHGVITTHYQNLKHFADDTPGLVNGAMLYDRQHMQPLFQLSIGYPGSSFAIEIARKIGLPGAVIDKAKELVGSDYVNMDKYLLDIVRDRKYWENKRYDIHQKEKALDRIVADYNDKLAKMQQEHKLIIKEAKSEAQEMLKQSNAQIENTIREIRETQAEKEKTREVRQHLEEFKQRLAQADEGPKPQQLQRLKPKKPLKQRTAQPAAQKGQDGPIAAGDNVVLRGATSVGTVMAIDGKWATVAFGNLKTRVEVAKLERTLRQPSKVKEAPSLSNTTTEEIRSRQLNFKQEIDVRGMRGDEALQAVTYFIDDAIQFQSHRVRILHGTGTGILRQLIRQYLNTVPGVASYHDEDVRFGGAGITVVELE